MENINALNIVEKYTMPISKDYKKYKKIFKKYISINKKNYGYIYDDSKLNFKFSFLSDYVDNNITAQELQSTFRYHNNINNNCDFLNYFGNGKIIIGFIKNDNNYKFHSWIETKINNIDKIIDSSKNILIDKDIYYELTNAEKAYEFEIDEQDKYKLLITKYIEQEQKQEQLKHQEEIMKQLRYIKEKNNK